MSETVSVRRVTFEDAAVVKDLRLAALADAPSAFRARYEDERAFPESVWRERLANNVVGEQSAGFLSFVGGEPRGLVVGVLHPTRPEAVELNALWVAPEGRGRGAARALIEAVCAWARQKRRSVVRLCVTDVNDGALELYRRCGFRETGARCASPVYEGVVEVTMARTVG